jgi:hypothetical protein
MVGAEGNPKILVNMYVTNAGKRVIRNAKTLELQHMQLPNITAAANLLAEHTQSIIRQMSYLHSITTLLMDKPLLPKREPSMPSLLAAFLPVRLMCADQISCLSTGIRKKSQSGPLDASCRFSKEHHGAL